MTEMKEILNGLGLSRKEGDVLLSLYALKKSTVAALAKESALPRTTVYSALAKLLDRQMVVCAKAGKRTLWEAILPRRLLAIKEDQVARLKTALPELERLAVISDAIEPSSIVQYKGTQGLQRAYDLILELGRGERVLGFEGGRSSENKINALPHAYSKDWQAAVKRKGIILEIAISEKILDIVDIASREMLEAAFGRASVTYLLPDEAMDSNSDILVFGSRVAVITPKQKTAVIITNPTTSAAFRQLIRASFTAGRKIDLNAYITQTLKKTEK